MTTTEAGDLELNGPLWDFHVVEAEPEITEEINRRRQLIQQGSQRVKRTAEDQALIRALQNQVEAEHSRAEATANELANFHQGTREVSRIQREHRLKWSICSIDSYAESRSSKPTQSDKWEQ